MPPVSWLHVTASRSKSWSFYRAVLQGWGVKGSTGGHKGNERTKVGLVRLQKRAEGASPALPCACACVRAPVCGWAWMDGWTRPLTGPCAPLIPAKPPSLVLKLLPSSSAPRRLLLLDFLHFVAPGLLCLASLLPPSLSLPVSLLYSTLPSSPTLLSLSLSSLQLLHLLVVLGLSLTHLPNHLERASTATLSSAKTNQSPPVDLTISNLLQPLLLAANHHVCHCPFCILARNQHHLLSIPHTFAARACVRLTRRCYCHQQPSSLLRLAESPFSPLPRPVNQYCCCCARTLPLQLFLLIRPTLHCPSAGLRSQHYYHHRHSTISTYDP